MSKLSLFFVFLSIFLSLKITAQTEKQLLQELKLQKNKTSQLQIRLRLLELIYERDRNEWQKEVLLLVNQRAAYAGTENQALISLVEAERASFHGNRSQLIKIFDEDDEIVFSRKFMIYENLANVGVQIKRSRDVKDVNTKQSVDFVINTTNFSFNNPKQTVNTVILQNNNLKTAISGLKPQYILGNELIYRYTTETSFWGGNEYLYFETKDVRGTNLGVQFTDLEDIYHSYLYLDSNRYNRGYTYNPDINGNFQITILDRDNPSIEADYTVVHFSLLNPELANESIYVYGSFNNFALNTSNEMIFNLDSGTYEKEIKLKQGFYNYKYVLVNTQGELEEGVISGDFYETENNYKVLVYYRDLGARYDRIVGFGEGTSTQIGN